MKRNDYVVMMNKSSHPNLYKAFELLVEDNSGIMRRVKTAIQFPEEVDLDSLEKEISKLSQDKDSFWKLNNKKFPKYCDKKFGKPNPYGDYEDCKEGSELELFMQGENTCIKFLIEKYSLQVLIYFINEIFDGEYTELVSEWSPGFPRGNKESLN